MIRSKVPKDEELTEENLVGKFIVDPDGNIIAKCVSLFEDDKKKIRMKVSIKTEVDSDFIVEETVPLNLISKIGEVILLKKSFEIEPISVQDIVQIEFPSFTEKPKEAVIKKETKEPTSTKVKVKTPSLEIESPKKPTKKKPKMKAPTPSKESFEEIFANILETEDDAKRTKLIAKLSARFNEDKKFQNKVIKNLLKANNTIKQENRIVIVDIIEKLAEDSSEKIAPLFIESLKATYNEPNKILEEKLANVLAKLATKYNTEIINNKFQKFCKELLIKRKHCKTVSLTHIHKLNLKIFVNNFSAQELIISTYFSEILVNKENKTEYAEFLKDFNAIIIAYSMIQSVDQNKWSNIMNCECMTDIHNEAFMDSINSILAQFREGNIKKLSEIFDPKLGMNFSDRLLSKMVKSNIDDVLANITILPLDTLSAYYNDENNRIIPIIFDLINNREINAQVSFIGEKTFISIPEDGEFLAFNKVVPVKRKEK